MAAKPASNGAAASKNITKKIRELGDWRGEMLAYIRLLIHAADPEIQEEWKWMGTPVWSHDGGVCTGETYKQVVKLTFFRGASLEDQKNCSTPVSRATRVEPSTFAQARSSTRRPSRN